ncbi:hypothetical protein EXN66_Car001892 [Channa argus]|uniref:Uncharacterized protein n=1 Tax=Channa argus TaxID=215402 RepID=A0A6G1P7E4_CHAAH|nr:hypothetical protein EXN66_Car001892 [Channa argus]
MEKLLFEPKMKENMVTKETVTHDNDDDDDGAVTPQRCPLSCFLPAVSPSDDHDPAVNTGFTSRCIAPRCIVEASLLYL